MELLAIKLAISFYWFLQRSLQLNAGKNTNNRKDTNIWDKIFKNEQSNIYGRQPLKFWRDMVYLPHLSKLHFYLLTSQISGIFLSICEWYTSATSSGKLRWLRCLLYVKWPSENAASLFLVFSFFQHMTFAKHFMKKSPFLKRIFKSLPKF